MRLNNEPIPEQRIAQEIIQGYGGNPNLGKYLDDVMTVIPIDQHLQTLEWLGRNMDGDRNAVYQYVLARLNEALGNNKDALQIYLQLSGQKYSNPTTVRLIDDGLRRVSIKPLPKLKPNREYEDDPLPTVDELWEFHKDTLLNFNFYNAPHNVQQAFDYFSLSNTRLEYKERYGELIAILDKARDRIKEQLDKAKLEPTLVHDKRKITKNMMHTAAKNLWEIWQKIGEFALAQQDYDKAISEFTDLAKLKSTVDREIWYELTTAYSLRAVSDNTAVISSKRKENDLDEALVYLKKYAALSLSQGTAIDWKSINNDKNLAALHAHKEYKKIAQGR
jgi:tetratricopeptide (TPR) repeat protein